MKPFLALGLAIALCACSDSATTSAGGGEGGTKSTVTSTVTGNIGGASGTNTGTTDASTGATAPTSTSTGMSNDPKQLCVDTINQFRATRGLSGYSRWNAEESCVDGEATTDGQMMSAHYSFIHGNTCNANAENECPNWNVDPLSPNDGIVACLTMMWGEKDQPGCAGCDTCDFPYQNCTNCTADGATVCGHYLDMKSSVLTKVACGFATDGWYTQNFAP